MDTGRGNAMPGRTSIGHGKRPLERQSIFRDIEISGNAKAQLGDHYGDVYTHIHST